MKKPTVDYFYMVLEAQLTGSGWWRTQTPLNNQNHDEKTLW